MKKITLGQARDGGATHLLFYCYGVTRGISCGRNAHTPLAPAIARYGADVSLDEVPAVCERCKSREAVEVRPYYPSPFGAPPL